MGNSLMGNNDDQHGVNLSRIIQQRIAEESERTQETREAVTKPAEPEKEAQETIQWLSVISRQPDKYVMPNTKLARSLPLIPSLEDSIEMALTVSRRGAKKKVTTSCILMYEGDNVKITGRQPFTGFDRAVNEAVISLWLAGNVIITAAMVWRTMNGKTEQEKPTPQQQAAVTKSIEKQRSIKATIDCSSEIGMYKARLDGRDITGGGFDDYLLSYRTVWINTSKGQIKAYKLQDAPILYEYSRISGQILSADISLLDIKKKDSSGRYTTHSLDYTEQRVLIRGHILRRIEGMKGNNALRSRCISLLDYDREGTTRKGLYSIAGFANASKKQMQNVRMDTEAILDYYKHVKYINDYKPYMKGKAIGGYEIIL